MAGAWGQVGLTLSSVRLGQRNCDNNSPSYHLPARWNTADQPVATHSKEDALYMVLESNWIVYGFLASIIASVHLWIGWFETRFERSENLWIGFVGGIAVGYVTLYMLPKLSSVTVRFIAANPDASPVLQYRAYFILLLGLRSLRVNAKYYVGLMDPLKNNRAEEVARD